MMTRTFVAVAVSDRVRARAGDLINRLRVGQAKVNWVAPPNMHVTLKFLGDQTDDQVVAICQAVQRTAAGVPDFEFGCRGVGAFPNSQRPRTIWIGVTEGSEPLKQLHASIDARLSQLGFARDRRGFHAHLTLGRVRSGGPDQLALGAALGKHADYEAGQTRANDVLVFGSQLRKSGPVYDLLARAPLAGS